MTNEPTKVMTSTAAIGATYESYVAAGWSDAQLIEHGIMEPRAAGHDTTTDERLCRLIERIERLEEEKKGVADDIRDVYGEGKSVGYDTKIMRQIYRLRKMKPDDRSEMETLLETYKSALGMG